jgi:hypothetical protein
LSSHDIGIESPDQTTTPARRTTPTRSRAVIAGVLVVLLVLGLIACGYLVFRLKHVNDEPLNPFSGASSVPSDAQRRQATAVAEQFALRMDNVDGTNFDGYVKKIEQLLTTKAKTENAKVFSAMGTSYKAAKIKGTGKLLLSGLGDIDQDSATVLVAHDASVTTPQGNLTHHYRWNVDLVKVHGRWLVNEFTPVS